MIKLVIADDQYLFSDGIKSLLSADPEIAVLGMAANGNEAYHLCELHQPDIVLMDINMPNCNGIEATARVKTSFPEIKVIILTTFNDDENIAKALKNGADGYILKDITPQELIVSMKAVMNNVKILHKDTFSSVVNTINISKISPPNFHIELTDEERALIRLIVNGNSNSEIAAQLFMSEGTARNKISAILQRLNLKDRIQLAVFALKNDLG